MWKRVVVVMLCIGAVLAPYASAQERPVNRSSWGAIKALYRGNTENPSETQQIEPSQLGVKKPGVQPAAITCYGWKFPFVGRWQISCFYGCGAHTGNETYAVDWNLPGWQDYGAYVVAPAGGRVLYAGWWGDYGNTVVVDAGYGRLYRVAHLSSFGVGANMSIAQGAILGRCGNTGQSSGPHIHFSVHSPASWGGGGRINGPSIPQSGISGQYNLYVGGWYNSYQWMSMP
ncbi:MAG: M23 family metallopeptidase [Candidatus Kerfeldbacteria bacterium]